MNGNVRCILVRPHTLPEEITLNNTPSAFEERIGGSYIILTIPQLGDSIGLLVREEGHIFSPEKNRPLFDENGNVYGCIYGDFCVVGLEKQSFRSLTNKEVILVQRLYETPYNIIIDESNNHFVACIPETGWELKLC